MTNNVRDGMRGGVPVPIGIPASKDWMNGVSVLQGISCSSVFLEFLRDISRIFLMMNRSRGAHLPYPSSRSCQHLGDGL